MKIGQDLHADFKGFLVSNLLTFLFCDFFTDVFSSFHRCCWVLTIDTNGTAHTSETSSCWHASDFCSNLDGHRRASSIIHQIILVAFLAPTKPFLHNI